MQNKIIQTNYTILSLDELTPIEDNLVKKAEHALENAHAPYSNFKVGCALLLSDETILEASNQENASYGLTTCAERNALVAAGSMGKKDKVVMLAVVGSPVDKLGEKVSEDKENIVSPCGACRQVIKEYEDLSGKKITILFKTNAQRIYKIEGIDSLLPFSFGPSNLQ